jgi:nicotinamidase-related amidase
MRLPADAVLIIIDAREGMGPDETGGDGPKPEHNISALIAAWRAEGLPLVHVGPQSAAPSPPGAAVPPLDGEIVVLRNATSAFAGTALEAKLDEVGATTLVLCGTLVSHALEASARHAADLGYQVFVVSDACQAVDMVDLNGRRWLAEDVRALTLAHLRGETATIVDVATALRASATAKARQRRRAGTA